MALDVQLYAVSARIGLSDTMSMCSVVLLDKSSIAVSGEKVCRNY